MVEIGSVPLVCHREVQATVPIDISRRDSSTHLKFVQAQVPGKVVVATVLRPHEERVVIVTAQIVARLKSGPTARVVQELIVAHRQFVQLGPAVHGTTREARCLECLENSVIVEISQPNVPAPTTSRKS